jgi:hypothetical protein
MNLEVCKSIPLPSAFFIEKNSREKRLALIENMVFPPAAIAAGLKYIAEAPDPPPTTAPDKREDSSLKF